MHRCTVSRWACLKTRAEFIGTSVYLPVLDSYSIRIEEQDRSTVENIADKIDCRFKDIGYNHIPFYNCPNSPKCKGRCTAGKFYAGEPFLQKEDCRPNWFKYVGTG